jgi:hypothetical protein
MKGVGFAGFLMVLGSPLAAQIVAQTDESAASAKAPWGSVDLGLQYVGWDSSYSLPFHGNEILAPLTLSVLPWSGGRIYGQTQFTKGNYTDSFSGTPETISLSGLTDTVLGFETDFKSFSLPSIINLGINLPTGDPTWETKQTNSIVPTEFIDSDYRGRGFGMSLLYGLSFTGQGQEYGVAGGYLYSGAFNPSYGAGAPAEQLKLGDSVFLSVNRAVDHGGGQSDILRASAFYFLPTLQDGSNLLRMGPNFNAAYGWNNPKALSFEVGGQYFLPVQQAVNGQLAPEPYNSLGPRFYLAPSYAFGNFSLAGQVKYILRNGYPTDNLLYDGGGFLVGLEPSFLFKLDSVSSLKVSLGYDYVESFDGSTSALGNRTNVEYGHFTLGTRYEASL